MGFLDCKSWISKKKKSRGKFWVEKVGLFATGKFGTDAMWNLPLKIDLLCGKLL